MTLKQKIKLKYVLMNEGKKFLLDQTKKKWYPQTESCYRIAFDMGFSITMFYDIRRQRPFTQKALNGLLKKYPQLIENVHYKIFIEDNL